MKVFTDLFVSLFSEIDECRSFPCQNGATCVDGMNSYQCMCASGWTGLRCTDNVDECASNPCVNGGSCFDLQNMYRCDCTQGWTGPRCETGGRERFQFPVIIILSEQDESK